MNNNIRNTSNIMESTAAPAAENQNHLEASSETAQKIIKKLNENALLIAAIKDYQSKGKIQECIQFHEILQHNLVYLSTAADSNEIVKLFLRQGSMPLLQIDEHAKHAREQIQYQQQSQQQQLLFQQQLQQLQQALQQQPPPLQISSVMMGVSDDSNQPNMQITSQAMNQGFSQDQEVQGRGYGSQQLIRPSQQHTSLYQDYIKSPCQGQSMYQNYATPQCSEVNSGQLGSIGRNVYNQQPNQLYSSQGYIGHQQQPIDCSNFPNLNTFTSQQYQANGPYVNQPVNYLQNTVSQTQNFSPNYLKAGYGQQSNNNSYLSIANKPSTSYPGYRNGPQNTNATSQTVQSAPYTFTQTYSPLITQTATNKSIQIPISIPTSILPRNKTYQIPITGNLQQQTGNLQQQTGNLQQQPGNLQQQPGNLQQQPGNLQQQTGNLQQQSGNLQQQTGNLQQQPGNIPQTYSFKQDYLPKSQGYSYGYPSTTRST